MTSRLFARSGVVALLLTCGACIGARPRVKLPTAQYPVSLSGALVDRDGSLLDRSRLVPIRRFHAERQAWATVYGFLPLNSIDISEEVNRQVQAARGEAIANLRVAIRDGGCWVLHMLEWSQILPFFVGCTHVVFDGDIVVVKRESPEAKDVIRYIHAVVLPYRSKEKEIVGAINSSGDDGDAWLRNIKATVLPAFTALQAQAASFSAETPEVRRMHRRQLKIYGLMLEGLAITADGIEKQDRAIILAATQKLELAKHLAEQNRLELDRLAKKHHISWEQP